MRLLELTLPGKPEPKGSTRAFVVGKRAVITSANKHLKSWQIAAVEEIQKAMLGAPAYEGAVRLDIECFFQRARSVRRQQMSTKPDLDKLIRAVGDSLVMGGALKDDSLIVSIAAAKYYTDNEPFTAVILERV